MVCPENIEDNVTGSNACQYSDTANQDFLNTNPITVNAEAFFGITDWIYAGKHDIDEGQDELGTANIGLTINPDNNQSGSWSINGDTWANWENVMLIFKDGNATTLVGYLLDGSSTSGTWLSPFENPPFDVRNTRDVSHISAYVSGERVNVPEPAPVAMLAFGIVAAGLVRRRKRS